MTDDRLDRLLAPLVLLAAAAPAQLSWREVGAQLPARAGHFAMFDAARGRTTVFGGLVTPTVYGNDCWQLEGNEWMQLPVPALTARGHGAYCEDPSGPGNSVLFSGRLDNGSLIGETLRFNAQTLRFDALAPATSPPPRWISAMAFDSVRGRAVLFGGGDAGGPRADTWEWDGTAWAQRSPARSPPARANHAMAYDAARQRVVLFGGHNGASLNDTWAYDGTTWTDVSPTNRPDRLHNSMLAYDARRGAIVLFGGKLDSGTVIDSTWEWNGSLWLGPFSPPTRPARRELASLTYDKQRQRLTLIGGQDSSGTLLGDAWAYDGSAWTELLPSGRGTLVEPWARNVGVLVYSQPWNKTVLFGGLTRQGIRDIPLTDTWEGVGRSWQRRTPSISPPQAFFGAGTILRSTGDLYYLPGSDILRNSFNEQWTWGGSQWVSLPLGAASIPAIRHQVLGSLQSSLYGWVMVRMVTSGTAPPYTSTLQLIQPFSGNAATITVPGGPGPRVGSVMVQSPSASIAPNKVWLFGGASHTTSGTVLYNDLWELADTGVGGNLVWTQIVPATGSVPPARTQAAAAHDHGNLIYIMGGLATGQLADTWTFDLTTRRWTQQGMGPAARSGAAMTHDPDVGIVLTGGFDGTSVLGDIWEFDGFTWRRRITADRPAARLQQPSMVYDRTNRRCIVYGGLESRGETWTYDGRAWSPIVGIGPQPTPIPRYAASACYDQAHAAMVMFGGRRNDTAAQVSFSDTYVFTSNGEWVLRNPTVAPPARNSAAMVYVASQRHSLLFGGSSSTGLLADGWTYDITSDRWVSIAGGPSPRMATAMAYDGRRDRVVLFGGFSGSVVLDDTWEYAAAIGWQQRTPTRRPPARVSHMMEYDASRGRTVLFGGQTATALLGDVWEWDGTDWLERSAETVAVPANNTAAMAYDSDRGRLILCGGRHWSAPLWELNATIDVTGRGNIAQPEGLRYYSQPILGQTFHMGFANPQGLALLGVALGPMQQPLMQLGAPLCEFSNVFTLSFLGGAVTGRNEPNVAIALGNNAALLGLVLVFQAFPYQATSCFRATDALNVRFH